MSREAKESARRRGCSKLRRQAGSRRIVRQPIRCAKSTARVSVPTPMTASGRLAHGFDGGQRYRVRRVIRSTRRPPADKARQRYRMLDLVMVRTGMTGQARQFHGYSLRFP